MVNLLDAWDREADESWATERARRAAKLEAERSREWLSMRVARAWLMDGTHCADFEAEAALFRTVGGVIPIRVERASCEGFFESERVIPVTQIQTVFPDQSDPMLTQEIESLFRNQLGGLPSARFEADWLASTFKMVDTFDDLKGFRTVTCEGVRVHGPSLAAHFDLDLPQPAPLVEQAPADSASPQRPAPVNTGGRPAAKHGDVIAAVTLRLAALPQAELARYTVDALATELQADYSAIGESPPNERNRETYAAGILRVLRARQT